MIAAREIMNYINEIAPFSTAMSFDNSGLLIGDTEQTSETVLLALDVTSEVIEEAVDSGAKIIISHHPVIFNPLKSIEKNSIPYLVVKNDITVISAHTNLDIAEAGVNNTLADYVGVVSENGTDSECLLIGELEKEISYSKRNGTIKRVGISCGAGGSNIFAAESAGAEAFVTGEIKHHEILFANEKNIAVFDIGHFRSEDMIIPELALILGEKFTDTVFKQAEGDTDKMIYI